MIFVEQQYMEQKTTANISPSFFVVSD